VRLLSTELNLSTLSLPTKFNNVQITLVGPHDANGGRVPPVMSSALV
jgi:hypothetical protein